MCCRRHTRRKGREWSNLRVAGDFARPKYDNDDEGTLTTPGRDELMLSYVAVTRAMTKLDRGSLDWIDDAMTALKRGTLRVDNTHPKQPKAVTTVPEHPHPARTKAPHAHIMTARQTYERTQTPCPRDSTLRF